MERSVPVRLVAVAGATLLTLACATGALGQPSPPRLTVALTAPDQSHGPPRALRLLLVVPSGWHIGAPPDAAHGTAGLPTRLTWTLPRGWRLSHVKWPIPARQIEGRDTVSAYTGKVIVEAWLDAPAEVPAGPVRVRIAYGLCRDVCIPGWATAALDP